MRLIDADKLEYGIVSYIGEFSRVPLDDIIKGWKKIVDAQPTSYDVDEVVEQLEECKRIMESPVQQDCFGEECKIGDCTICAFEKAIEIVKVGGVNG